MASLDNLYFRFESVSTEERKIEAVYRHALLPGNSICCVLSTAALIIFGLLTRLNANHGHRL
jgi:hypothetical protein